MCYSAIRKTMVAEKAEEECQSMDSHVASPTNKGDLNFFRRAGACDRFWLGATNVKDAAKWRNKDNTLYLGYVSGSVFLENIFFSIQF